MYASSCADAVLSFLLVACLAWCRLGGAAATSEYMFSSEGAFAAFVTGAGESSLFGCLTLCLHITQHWTQHAVTKQHRSMKRITSSISTVRSCRSSSRALRVI